MPSRPRKSEEFGSTIGDNVPKVYRSFYKLSNAMRIDMTHLYKALSHPECPLDMRDKLLDMMRISNELRTECDKFILFKCPNIDYGINNVHHEDLLN